MTDVERLADAIMRLADAESGAVQVSARGGGATINITVNLTVHTAPQMWKPSFSFLRPMLRVRKKEPAY